MVSSLTEMQRVPRSIQELFELLQIRHSELLSARLAKEPSLKDLSCMKY